MSAISAKKLVAGKSGGPRPAPVKEHVAARITYPLGAGVSIGELDVTGATDLGRGYVLVQLKVSEAESRDALAKSTGPAQLLAENVPEIPGEDVRALLKELAERGLRNAHPPLESPSQAALVPQAAQEADKNDAFMARLTQQSLAGRAQQVKSGLLLTSADLCEQRHITRQALSKAVKDGRVFWLDGPSGMQLYPAFFAKPKSERLAFEQVSRALGELPGASKWQFFTSPKRSLGGISPADALDKGMVAPVMAAALAFAER